MSVSKRKVGSRFLKLVALAFVVYVIGMFFFLNGIDSPSKLDGFQKTSVDNTPIFNLTEPHTQCQYVYDSVNKTVKQAKGSEHCELPSFN
ncbi:hypothetical protein pEaSNUABM37_00072 [Erwinia phage pEa_SNUABM_37]|nr:hypothetical protein pEaSNUABM37_00072 [Erwinia phage pEa_SNUABM_37]QXO10542.1 hypothetical protein pEaSNUABM48_00072 [Erwinia phage pEa_SNUABM_48]